MGPKHGGSCSRGWISCAPTWCRFTRGGRGHGTNGDASRPGSCGWRHRASAGAGAGATSGPRSHLHQAHCADSSAQLRELPSARRRRADVAAHLRRGAPVGARDQAAHRDRPARRRDAAVVRREEHRHPEIQERSVAQRRRDRDDREVGRQRRAARQSRRHAAAADVDRLDQVVDRRARSRRPHQGHRRQRHRAGLVGRDSARADRPDRRSIRVGARDPRSERRRDRQAPAARPSAAATCSTT